MQSTEQTNYGLTLIAGGSERLALRMGYEGVRYERGRVERLLSHLEAVLEEMSGEPNRKVGELRLTSEREERELLEMGRGPRVGYRTECGIHRLFEEQVERTPFARAVISGEEEVSYEELNRRAEMLARRLRSRGVGAESLVGVRMGRGVGLVVSLLGVLKAGGAYVPLDPEYPEERLEYMAREAGLKALLTDGDRSGVEIGVELLQVGGEWESWEEEEESEVRGGDEARADNLAYVIYTSGSTGRPKGVAIPHRGLVNCMQAMVDTIGLDTSHCFFQFASFSFDVAAFQIFATLISGATLVMPTSPSVLSDLELLELCVRHGVTVLDLPVSLWNQWLERMASGRIEVPAHLKVFMTGGEKLSAEKVELWSESVKRPAKFISSYGLTETTICTAMFQATTGDNKFDRASTIPLGQPLANTQIYILNDRLEATPVDVPGQIYIGGVGVARGYHNDTHMTADRFIPDPFGSEAGARMYQTGDLARRLESGEIEFLGRIDEQVKIRGFRVELAGIEATLRAHPAVQDAVILLREELPGDKRLVGYIVAKTGLSPSIEDLRKFLKERVPEYMIPAVFIMMDHLPLTPSGKIDRRALPALDRIRPELVTNYVPPKTEREKIIASIWQKLLQIERVGVHDNFFDLGGHSLLMLQALDKVREAFSEEAPMMALYKHPTIRELASFFDESLKGRSSVQEAQDKAGRQREALNNIRQTRKRRKPS